MKAYMPTRKLTKRDMVAINRAAADALLQDIFEIEDKAMRLGFPVTTRALNRAKNALGWEIAGDVIKADEASRRHYSEKE
jgi:hypothetical protein